jgi:hypothetical protein
LHAYGHDLCGQAVGGDVWSVGSAVEPSVGREISRSINVCMSGVNQGRAEGFSSVQRVFEVVRECWWAECAQEKALCKQVVF